MIPCKIHPLHCRQNISSKTSTMYYKLTLLLCFITLHIGIQLRAQVPAGIGIKTGINISDLYPGHINSPLYSGYRAMAGSNTAIQARMILFKHCSLQGQIEYSQQGANRNGNQAIPVPDQIKQIFPAESVPAYVYANCKSSTRLNYLVVQAIIVYRWGKANGHWRRYIGAGPFLGILLSAKTNVTGNSMMYLDPAHSQPVPAGNQTLNMSRNEKEQMNTFNTGVKGLLGVAYKTGRLRYFIETGGSYGFGNLLREETGGSLHSGTLTINAGVEFRFSVFDNDN